MSIKKEEVLHIAELSRLKLSDEELEKYMNDLSSIVDYANELSNIDITGVEPTNHILDIKNVFRKDEVKSSFEREKILANAPTKAGGCITVPKVME